jgi:hypothetical protein
LHFVEESHLVIGSGIGGAAAQSLLEGGFGFNKAPLTHEPNPQRVRPKRVLRVYLHLLPQIRFPVHAFPSKIRKREDLHSPILRVNAEV